MREQLRTMTDGKPTQTRGEHANSTQKGPRRLLGSNPEPSCLMADTRTFADVRNTILSAHENTETKEKVAFYNTWAESYEQLQNALLHTSPARKREPLFWMWRVGQGWSLDMFVFLQLKKMGFRHFVGVDGSEGMLNLAKKPGLFQEVKQCMLGQDPLPVQDESYDVVVIVGGLSFGNVPVPVIKELWQATKPGGFVCMTTRGNIDNLEYKAELERVIQSMEEEKKWHRVSVTVVDEWEKAVSELESGYIPGVIYLYQRT
ncbi:methyltransferase-like protein 27 isoform X2 [Neoarius graeffei]|uniref:methyltransferase-like protein 27 isoform X2 n=1 Tax=Neoarius graeffei TaxID=443677 RepID=UPI00298BE5F2|nr:methyltransferase-like protein 27 isoform X2 [Neoarius graeffei]